MSVDQLANVYANVANESALDSRVTDWISYAVESRADVTATVTQLALVYEGTAAQLTFPYNGVGSPSYVLFDPTDETTGVYSYRRQDVD